MSNLRLINETSASSVASISVNDIFTSDFDIYKVVINNLDIATANYMRLRFVNSSGSVISASNYDYAFLSMTANTTFAEGRSTNNVFISINESQGSGTADGTGLVFYVFNPFSSSSYTFVLNQSSTFTGTYNRNTKGIAVLKQTASMTGINMFSASGNIDDITIKTYGLRVDS